MKQVYKIVNSKLLVTNMNHQSKKNLRFWLSKITWCMLSSSICLFTGFVFYIVLYPNAQLYDVISLGAVFATLGSTLVSIASLLCNKYYETFSECLNIFKDELSRKNVNYNWLFLKNHEIIKISKNEYLSYQSSNPKVFFEIGAVNLVIEVPVQKKDFYELELLKKIIQMKVSRKIYVTYLFKHADTIMESGMYVWECVYHILCSAFLYKIFRDFIIVGTLFFISGLLATFLYPCIF